jgi:chemotaxis signal transduction protein
MEQESTHRPGRYLAIQVGGRYYAFENECVREITPARDLFPPLPAALDLAGNPHNGLAGFLHAHNTRVPVFDLHVRLGGPARELCSSTQARIVVIEVHDARVGIYADRVTDMLQARAHEIRKDTIIGHGRPKAILSVERLWTARELAELT